MEERAVARSLKRSKEMTTEKCIMQDENENYIKGNFSDWVLYFEREVEGRWKQISTLKERAEKTS